MSGRVLVAGIGNVFFGDDGFGPAVVARLRRDALPGTVDVGDFGIRGLHLAYELLEGHHRALVMVDALPMGGPPGTLAVVEVDGDGQPGDRLDAHSMSPAAVGRIESDLAGIVVLVNAMGGTRIVDMLVGDPLPRIC